VTSVALLAAGFAGVLAFTYARVILRLLNLRLHADQRVLLVERADVPSEIVATLENEGREIESLGFEPFAFGSVSPGLVGTQRPIWLAALRNARERTFALLAMSLHPSRTRSCDLQFRTLGANGGSLETVDFRASEQTCPRHIVVEAQTASRSKQWERHLRELAERTEFFPKDASPEELIAQVNEDVACARQRKLATGFLRPAGEGELRLSLRGAIQTRRGIVRANGLRHKALGAHVKELEKSGVTPTGVTAAPVESDITADVHAHQRRDEGVRHRPTGWAMKLGLFLVSVAVFAVTFGLKLSVENTVVMCVVILIHELGHALAMRAFGYRDLQILFIPFLGAVASGNKREVKPHQEILVLLAGPVPGIVVGTALFVTASHWPAWVQSAATMMLIVNYLNLLPFDPLDGGRMMAIALFDRFPKLQLGFSTLGGLALAFAGQHWDEKALYFVGLASVLGVPRKLGELRLVAGARKRIEAMRVSHEAVDPVPALYTEMRQPRWDKLTPEAKYQLVTRLSARLMRNPASAALSLVAIAGWLTVMALPLGVIAYKPFTRLAGQITEIKAKQAQTRAEWTARIANARTPREELAARAGAVRVLGFETEEGRRIIEPARALFHDANDPALEASALLELAKLERRDAESDSPDPKARAKMLRDLDRALDLREQTAGPESMEVAEVLGSFPDDPHDRAGALVRSGRLIGIWEGKVDEDESLRWPLAYAYTKEAALRDDGGDAARAEAELARGLALAERAPDGERQHLQGMMLAELTGFYLAHERFDDAAANLDKSEALEKAELAEDGDSAPPAPREPDRCWLRYWSGDAAAASHCFSGMSDALAKQVGDAENAALLALDYRIAEAAAAERAGQDAEARKVLGQLRDTLHASLDQSLDDYLNRFPSEDKPLDFARRELERRREECKRVLEPLLASIR
jgi:Zn-dependent protease